MAKHSTSRPMKNYDKVPTHQTDTRAGVPTDSGKKKKKKGK